jgi:hypothetical protein
MSGNGEPNVRGGTDITLAEIWYRLKATGNISDIYQIIVLFVAIIGTGLSRYTIFKAIGIFFGNTLYFSVVYISPHLRFDLQRVINEFRVFFILAVAATAGLFISIGYPSFFAWRSGTLAGSRDKSSEIERVYLLNDGPDLIIYTVISPLYLALSIGIIIIAIRGWLFFPQAEFALGKKRSRISSFLRRMGVYRFMNFITMLIFLSFVPIYLNLGQFDKIMQMDHMKKGLYWFLDLSPNGDRVLNGAGVAYFVLNTMKLSIICGAVVCFLASGVEVIRLAKVIGGIRNEIDKNLENLKVRLRHYAIIELLAKGLVFVLAAHTPIFAQQPWSPPFNVSLQALALLGIGIMFVPLPRIYFEYKWLMADWKDGIVDKWPDLRPTDIKLYFVIMSFFLYSLFAIFFLTLGDPLKLISIMLSKAQEAWHSFRVSGP